MGWSSFIQGLFFRTIPAGNCTTQNTFTIHLVIQEGLQMYGGWFYHILGGIWQAQKFLDTYLNYICKLIRLWDTVGSGGLLTLFHHHHFAPFFLQSCVNGCLWSPGVEASVVSSTEIFRAISYCQGRAGSVAQLISTASAATLTTQSKNIGVVTLATLFFWELL